MYEIIGQLWVFNKVIGIFIVLGVYMWACTRDK